MAKLVEQTFGLDGLNVIVTGAARGIGQAIAEMMAGCGARVVIADRDEQGGGRVAERIGDAARFVAFEQGDPASIEAMFAQAEAWLGSIDVLVNNAAMIGMWPLADMSVDLWDRMQAVNVRGVYLCLREAVARMRSTGKGGRIINISSMASVHPAMHDAAAYCASKGAVNALTRSAALDCGPDGIRINAILPQAIGHEHAASQFEEHHITIPDGPSLKPERFPLGTRGEPRDIATMATFLAGPGASFISGQTFTVDGGFLVS